MPQACSRGAGIGYACTRRASAPGRDVGRRGFDLTKLRTRWTRAPLLAGWLAAAGCTTLRELPRSEYAARPERRNVRVSTTQGLVYEFDYAQVANDTLVGYRQRDTEGPVPEVATFAIPLDDIARLSVRGVDWYRTSLVGGGVIAGVLAASLARKSGDSGGGTTSGGGKPVPE